MAFRRRNREAVPHQSRHASCRPVVSEGSSHICLCSIVTQSTFGHPLSQTSRNVKFTTVVQYHLEYPSQFLKCQACDKFGSWWYSFATHEIRGQSCQHCQASPTACSCCCRCCRTHQHAWAFVDDAETTRTTPHLSSCCIYTYTSDLEEQIIRHTSP